MTLNDYAKQLFDENQSLRKQIDELNKEVDRKTYVTSGVAALIIGTKDPELIHRAEKITEDAYKL